MSLPITQLPNSLNDWPLTNSHFPLLPTRSQHPHFQVSWTSISFTVPGSYSPFNFEHICSFTDSIPRHFSGTSLNVLSCESLFWHPPSNDNHNEWLVVFPMCPLTFCTSLLVGFITNTSVSLSLLLDSHFHDAMCWVSLCSPLYSQHLPLTTPSTY